MAGRLASGLSRRIGLGEGSVVGGRLTLALDPCALERLAHRRSFALVSGTNGKTTTTRLLAAAMATAGPVVSNTAGANLLAGLVGTLSSGTGLAVLEVDEGLLARAVESLRPSVVVLLNLSRDQLDRIGEVRTHAAAWRRAWGFSPDTTVVANIDDPLVVWAAEGASRVVWVETGARWRADAGSCPSCDSRIRWDDLPTQSGATSWACSGCPLSRPTPDLALVDDRLLFAGDDQRLALDLALPGWCNRANAAMALAAAIAIQPDLDRNQLAAALAVVGSISGRYSAVTVNGRSVRLLLAKNPAGWAEALDMLSPSPTGLVIGINARTADGRDPSWLWDVDFERLRGRSVVATGDRGRDLAVRLRYAAVDHVYIGDYVQAVAAAGASDIDLVANYTSFQDARRVLS